MKLQLGIAMIWVILLTGAAAGQKLFYDKEFKFGFKYPTLSKLSASDVVASEPLKGLVQVSLTRAPRGVTDATATISAAIMTFDQCKALATEGTPLRKQFGRLSFAKTEMVEGGMETVHPMEFYRVYHSGACYEVRMMVGVPKRSKAAADRAAFEQLYIILRTFYFGK